MDAMTGEISRNPVGLGQVDQKQFDRQKRRRQVCFVRVVNGGIFLGGALGAFMTAAKQETSTQKQHFNISKVRR